MKILIVTQYFWPENFLVNSLASDLKKRGHEVSVLTGLPNYPQGKFFPGFSFWRGPWTQDYHGVQVNRVPLKSRGSGFLSLALNYASFVVFGVTASIFRVQKSYDVIFCFAPSPITSCIPAIFIKFWTSTPLVFWVQDLWPESVAAVGATKSTMVLRVLGRLVKFIYSHCDIILVQSQAFTSSVISWGGAPEKIRYVPNWAKAPGDSFEQIPDWLKDAPKGFKVVFAGNIGKAQDMPTILEAATLLKEYLDIHWLIVGDGSEKSFVEKEIFKRNLNHCVHLYGRRPSEDMPALNSVGDVLLVSLADQPIFSLTIPSKIQGYMASRKPILAALNGEGAKIVAESGAGISCPSGDGEALAEAVLSLRRMSQEERLQMGKNGYKYFEKYFEESVVVQQIENICMEVANTYRS